MAKQKEKKEKKKEKKYTKMIYIFQNYNLKIILEVEKHKKQPKNIQK